MSQCSSVGECTEPSVLIEAEVIINTLPCLPDSGRRLLKESFPSMLSESRKTTKDYRREQPLKG